MSETTKEFLGMAGTANAGSYKSTVLGKIKAFIYNDKTLTFEEIIQQEVILTDISFYQRYANFEAMKNAGVSGAIFRAGQNTWEDSCVQRYMDDAEDNKMPFGTYWFYDSRVSPQSQAKKWKEVLGNHKTQLMCWSDYEENYGGQYRGWKYLYDFLEACKQEMPDRKFGIYTGYYYWLNNSPIMGASLDYFAQYPLWLAWYTMDSTQVKVPRPWSKLTIWQNTAKGDGTKLGVGSLNIDMDVFNGTKEEFKDFFGITDNGGKMPDITYIGTIKAGFTVVVRETAAGADTLQRLHGGDSVQGIGGLVTANLNGISYSWLNITSPVIGWIATSSVDNLTKVGTTSHKLEVILDGEIVFTKEF